MPPYLSHRRADADRWMPRRGEHYFAILGDGTIQRFPWHDTAFDYHAWQFGNCFRARKEAEYARSALQEAFRHVHQTLRQYCAQHQQFYATFCVYCGQPGSRGDGAACVPQRGGQGATDTEHKYTAEAQ